MSETLLERAPEVTPDPGPSPFERFDPTRVPSPCYVVDEARVARNLGILSHVQRESGAKVLLALKAFSLFALAPLVMRHLTGTAASGLYEARLGREEYGGEVHTFSAAFTDEEIEEVLALSDHVTFNSLGQWRRFRDRAEAARARRPGLRFALRINPEYGEVETPLYDPTRPNCRLGVVRSLLDGEDLEGLDGLHFHTLSDQGFGPLERTLERLEASFGDALRRVKCLNIGGGHLMTAGGYALGALIRRLKQLRDTYDLQVYLEPGTSVSRDAGILVCRVADLTWNGKDIAILDCSATCHMPDVIEMPYQPNILGATPGENTGHVYEIGGPTCLAGDILGTYAFPRPLSVGQRLTVLDQATYTMVKTSTFNGIGLPAIAIWNSETDALRTVKTFGYEDFRNRLS